MVSVVVGTYIIDFPSVHSKDEINKSMKIPVEDPFFLIWLPSNICLFCDSLGVLYTYNSILKKTNLRHIKLSNTDEIIKVIPLCATVCFDNLIFGTDSGDVICIHLNIANLIKQSMIVWLYQ
jgi:hypothetical protein